MYKKVIKSALEYTRPFLIGRLYYKNKFVSNDISTLIVLNKDGDILTTAHNADIFLMCSEYNETYPPILKEIDDSRNKAKIEKKYGIKEDTIVGMNNCFIDIANVPGKLTIIKHPSLDLAIIKIENNNELLVNKFPEFSKNNLEPGDSICTVGFALPEYKAFEYDKENYKIRSSFEFMNFPIFPTTGIMCRNIADKDNKISMLEMSNNIICGQEGGPIIGKDNLVYGMISGYRVINDANGTFKLGIGINVTTILEFLDQNNIKYEVKDEKE